MIEPTLHHVLCLDSRGLHRMAYWHWATLERAANAIWAISQGFGLRSREQWLALCMPQLKPDAERGFTLRCDPAIAVPLEAVSPELAQAGEALLWQSHDRLRCPTLRRRGEQSDLLSRATARAMARRGPQAGLHEFAGVGDAPTLVRDGQIEALRRFLWSP